MKHKHLMSKLGLTVPVVQAPMANVSTPQVASEVYKAGGLGSLALSPIDLSKNFEPVFEQIAKFRSQCNSTAIVNCNFFCFEPKEQHAPTSREIADWYSMFSEATNTEQSIIKNKVQEWERAVISFKEFEDTDPNAFNDFIERLIAAKVGVVSFHFGVPSPHAIKKLQDGGIMVWGCVTSVDEAQYLTRLGIDALVCQGYEAGGHRGNFLVGNTLDENLSTSSLFAQVKRFTDSLTKPPYLIPAGGIVSGASVSDYLTNGAAAVQMGTIFIPTKESSAPDFISNAISDNKWIPTIMTKLISGRNARTLATEFIRELEKTHAQARYDLPTFGYSTSAYRNFAGGQRDYGFYLAGQNYHFVTPNKTTAETMEQLKQDITRENEH